MNALRRATALTLMYALVVGPVQAQPRGDFDDFDAPPPAAPGPVRPPSVAPTPAPTPAPAPGPAAPPPATPPATRPAPTPGAPPPAAQPSPPAPTIGTPAATPRPAAAPGTPSPAPAAAPAAPAPLPPGALPPAAPMAIGASPAPGLPGAAAGPTAAATAPAAAALPPAGAAPPSATGPFRLADARNVTADNPFGDPPPPPSADTRPPPTEEQIAALRELEAEVEPMMSESAVYRGFMRALLDREHDRQRRVRTRWYTQRMREEQVAMLEARSRAIVALEEFIDAHPFDATYTPDAMYRLGELYFERSQQQADDASRAIVAGTAAADVTGEADYSATVAIYRTLVSRFPGYERVDSVLYLIGYCAYFTSTDPNGRREARAAWLGITCPNRFAYVPDSFDAGPTSRDPMDAAIRAEQARIAATTDADFAIATAAAPTGRVDRPAIGRPFEGCAPMQTRSDEGRMGNSRHHDEAWLRIGDTYFEEEGTLQGRLGAWLAIDAYVPLLREVDRPYYEGALYKTAWAHFKVTGYIEAARTFVRLLNRIEEVQRRGGRIRAGAQLRPEALRFFALSLVYIDWEELAVVADGANALTLRRLRELARDDAEWSAEAYFETGRILLEEQRYLDAIAIWRWAITRWPTHRLIPEMTEEMRLALHHIRDAEGERVATEMLGRYGEGTPWWMANEDHPAEQVRAQQLARDALLSGALYHHEQAQARRAGCNGDERTDPGCHAAARREYLAAVEAYRLYLRQYPNDPGSYELHFSLADALFRGGEYGSAAAEFEWVRDSNLDNAHVSDAGRGAVEAYRHMLDDAVQSGRVVPRTEPPPVDAQGRINSIPIPDLILSLARARQTYNARVDEAHDDQARRALYEYDNAIILYRYGYWNLARQRLERIFDERCSGPNANSWGQDAWTALRAMAVARGDSEQIASLARALADRECTFSPDGPVVRASREFCQQEANVNLPQCQGLRDLTALQYREALLLFQRAQNTQGPEQRTLYETAATMLVAAVDRHPDDPQAPQALELAAQALTATQRFESAGRLYERIVQEVGSRSAATDEERLTNDLIVANAYFQLAENAKQEFDFDRAIGFYRQLAESPRFASATDARILRFRRDGVTNAALLLSRLRRFSEASEYYRRLIALSEDPVVRRDAELEIAVMAFESRDYATATRLLREFIRRYGADTAAAAVVVEAYAKLAECVRETRREGTEYRQALTDVVTAFQSSGLPPGSQAAFYAAQAAYALADVDTSRVLAVSLTLGTPGSRDQLLEVLAAAVTSARTTIVDPYVERMAAVEGYRIPQYFIAARVAQARAYERLVEATRESLRNVDYRALVVATFRTRFTEELRARGLTGASLRRTLEQLMQRVEDEGRIDEGAFGMQTDIETQFDAGLAAIQCDVIVRYVTAVRVAQARHVDDASVQYALNRLQAYGEEQIGACVEGFRATDASFAPYTAGEFRRATQRPGIGAAGSYPVPGFALEER